MRGIWSFIMSGYTVDGEKLRALRRKVWHDARRARLIGGLFR